MGLAGAGALVAILLAYAAQSPRFLARAGVSGRRMQMRQRGFVGLALALQVLALGFFVAGVPLEPVATAALPTPAPTATVTPETAGAIVALTDTDLTATAVALASPTPSPTRPGDGTPATGAFGGLPTATFTTTRPLTPTGAAGTPGPAVAATAAAGPAATTPTAAATAAATPTGTPSPTPSPPPSPTFTPSPTVSPTPISGETAVVRVGDAVATVQRVPGGAAVARLLDGDLVILQPGHANYGGDVWQEIVTVDGTRGWLPEAVLETGDAG